MNIIPLSERPDRMCPLERTPAVAHRPILEQIAVGAARALSGADYLLQRKSDGQHCFVTTPRFEALKFNAEAMSHGGRSRKNATQCYRVNDVMLDGLDTRSRWLELQRMARHFPDGWELEREIDDIESAIANGEEGGVLKPWHQPFGIGWLKAKRSENFIVRITEGAGAAQSVTIADAATGEPRGKVPLRSGKCDQVRVGSILKVTGYGITARGLIREPRPDNDTPTSWLVKY